MRGAPAGPAFLARDAGIIPADAGSTAPDTRGTRFCRDHPRGCGEHPALSKQRKPNQGSSPRMRGALIVRRGGVGGVGIIPADAGSTLSPANAAADNVDHPRGCGDHDRDGGKSAWHAGSSPRMRGAQSGLTRVDGSRIIPADAGSTPRQPCSPPAPGDHPRGCGEHSIRSCRLALQCGSSPRMRGAPHGPHLGGSA